jgi:hypothetical protein
MTKLTISRVDGGDSFECQFNPTDFQISKTNNWTTEPAIGTNSETVKFTGGAAQDISLKLLFDNTIPLSSKGNDFDTSEIGKSVTERRDYKTLCSFTQVDPATQEKDHTNKGEPPRLKVQWGNLITFTAVITQFTEHFLLFTANGDALRAEVSLTLKQAVDNSKKPGQNPTSRSEPRRTWLVRQGERLDLIAYQAYGDSAAWRFIAQSNGLINPQTLRAGQILRLPSWQSE